jgi:hypothetical protein
MKKSLSLLLLLFICSQLPAQIRLTEVAPTNTGQITDEDGDRPDWIEIRNGSTQVANLAGWGLSDGGANSRWLLPETNINPGERILVFASGKNKGGLGMAPPNVNHWETAIYDTDEWNYKLGASPVPADWKSIAFDASSWSLGNGGFGYGDGDDATIVPTGTITVYIRRIFTVADPAQLKEAILNIDYDDGFVAYLNGQEIARSTNLFGQVDHTTLAIPDREATGTPPETYSINALTLTSLLVPGDNVLAVEIHNTDVSSSDMTGRAWLHFGIGSSDQFYGTNPPWFSSGGGTGASLMHTDFKLNFNEHLTLYDASGNIADSLTIGTLQPGHSRMRINDDGFWCHTDGPTPAAPNGWNCLDGYASAPGFALPAGFYNGSQSLALTGGSEIRYSTDGSIPTLSSPIYSSPLNISSTTVVRARSFSAGKLPSAVVTSTYFIDEPTTLTAVSISLPPSDFSEVYDNYSRKGSVAVEYFDKNRDRKFSGDFAGYVVGNWSVSFAQKSLQFDADEEFGSLSEIKYPIFAPDKPISSYRSFRIRNEDDDWVQARMRDRIVNELAAETHAARAAYRNVAAFINGNYWGHYVARERLDNYFVRDNYGADPDSVNMVKTHYGQPDYAPEYGTIDDFYDMSNFIMNNDMMNTANYNKAAQLLDLDNFTDYMETEIFVASTDWLQDYFNNFRLFKTEKNAPWKFLLWDVSYSSGNASGCVSCDVLGSTLANNSRYARILKSLLENPEYRRYFINRFADLMNTSFLSTRAHNLVNTNAAELGPEINRHNERWGTGDFNHWSDAVQGLLNFYTDRPFNQRQHIIDNFQLDQEVSINLNVNPPGAGTIKISTIIPKSLPWTGIYFHGNPVTVTAIPNAGFSFSNWTTNPNISNPTAASFTADVPGNTSFTANFNGAPQPVALKISEINYHSHPSRDGGDWFEIRNESADPVDVSDFSIRDKEWFHRYTLPTGTVIPANSNLVVADNLLKFNSVYPNVTNTVPNALGFELSDNTDTLLVFDRNNEPATSAAYSDGGDWPNLADGMGLTLERKDGSLVPNASNSWFLGCVGGSPGAPFTTCPESSLISEINYNSEPAADAGDWIELYNHSDVPFHLDGWQLRDDDDTHGFTFPQGTFIPEQGHLVLFQDDAKFSAQFPQLSNKMGPIGFGLSGESDLLRLFDGNGRIQLCMRYLDSLPWPIEPDGMGYTLEKTDPVSLLNSPLSWQKGCLGGSPGVAFDPSCLNVGLLDLPLQSTGMHIWPNPASDQVFIELTDSKPTPLRMMDAFGRLVLNTVAYNGFAKMDVKQLPKGIYWIVAGQQTAKVILR